MLSNGSIFTLLLHNLISLFLSALENLLTELVLSWKRAAMLFWMLLTPPQNIDNVLSLIFFLLLSIVFSSLDMNVSSCQLK